MSTAITKGALVLDDGQFFVELDGNYPTCVAPGFLWRRCYVGVTTPGGYECIGGFDRDARGLWQATIDMPYNDVRDSDSLEVGGFKDRLDAIVALWGIRRKAHCRHQSE